MLLAGVVDAIIIAVVRGAVSMRGCFAGGLPGPGHGCPGLSRQGARDGMLRVMLLDKLLELKVHLINDDTQLICLELCFW